MVHPFALADINLFGLRGLLEKQGVGQVIVNNDIGPLQAVQPLDGHQPRISRTGPYEVDVSLLVGHAKVLLPTLGKKGRITLPWYFF